MPTIPLEEGRPQTGLYGQKESGEAADTAIPGAKAPKATDAQQNTKAEAPSLSTSDKVNAEFFGKYGLDDVEQLKAMTDEEKLDAAQTLQQQIMIAEMQAEWSGSPEMAAKSAETAKKFGAEMLSGARKLRRDELRQWKDLELLVVLDNFEDDVKVWRRIRVASCLSLTALGKIINAAFGWAMPGGYHAGKFHFFTPGADDDSEGQEFMIGGNMMQCIDMMHARGSYMPAERFELAMPASMMSVAGPQPDPVQKPPRTPEDEEEAEAKHRAFGVKMFNERLCKWAPEVAAAAGLTAAPADGKSGSLARDGEEPRKGDPDSFLYIYDLGDSWAHRVHIERVVDVGAGDKPRPDDVPFARLLGGAGACPPEDAGGTSGYRGMLDLFRENPRSADAREKLEWLESVHNVTLVDGKLDPTYFDFEERSNLILRMVGGK